MNVSVGDRVEPMSDIQARNYFRQIILGNCGFSPYMTLAKHNTIGVEYLHYNDVVHRDLKPENILLSEDLEICKLVDFGVSEMFMKVRVSVLYRLCLARLN
jgi:[calcium/calmodulin-dependent protein kinase] kinase